MVKYKPYKRYKVRCIETDKTYNSPSEAANAIGCGRSAMCNHLKGNFPTIRGYTFERIKKE